MTQDLGIFRKLKWAFLFLIFFIKCEEKLVHHIYICIVYLFC